MRVMKCNCYREWMNLRVMKCRLIAEGECHCSSWRVGLSQKPDSRAHRGNAWKMRARVMPFKRWPKHGVGWLVQGYMYVEAYKEAHVKEAIRGLRVFYQSKGAKMVPLREMVDAIAINRKAKAAVGVPPSPSRGSVMYDLWGHC